MTVLNFPSNPQNGDTYTAPNGTLYTYDGVKWVVTTTTITGEQTVNFVQDSVAPMLTGMSGNGVTVSYDAGTNSMNMTVDSLVSGEHNFSLNLDGTLSLDGELFTGSGSGDRLTNNGYNLILDSNGTTTFPGDLIVGAADAPDAGHIYIDNSLNGATSIRWVNSASSNHLVRVYSDGKDTLANERLNVIAENDSLIITTTRNVDGLGNDSNDDFIWQFNSDGTLNIAGSGTIRNPNEQGAVNLVSTGPGFSQLQWVPDTPTYESDNPDNHASYTHWAWIDSGGFTVEMTETSKTWLFDPNGTLYTPDFSEIYARQEMSITAGGGDDVTTWVKQYLPVDGNQYFVRALDYDSDSNLIILGVSWDQESAWIMKVNPYGNLHWRRSFTASTYAQAMAVDGNGNIYVGHSRNRGSVVKLNSAGEFVWEVDIVSGPNPQIMDMEFVSGNLIVTGRDNNIDGVNNKDSMWGVHISDSGIIGWQSSLTALDVPLYPNNITGVGMATDPSTGYTLMVGSTDLTPGSQSTSRQIILDLIDGDGENVKTVMLQNEFNENFELRSADAACDPNGNGWYVYMVYGSNDNGLTLGVTKLNAALDTVIWSQGYRGTCIDLAANIVTDSNGDVWIFGTYTTFTGFINTETFIRRVDPNTGDTTYQAHFGTTATADISASELGGNDLYSEKAGRLLAVSDTRIAVSGITLLDNEDGGDNRNIVSWVAQLPKGDTVAAIGNYRLTNTSFEYFTMNPVLTDVSISATHNGNFYEFAWTDEGDIYSVEAPWLITEDFKSNDSTWTFRKDRVLDTPNGSIGDVAEYGGFDFYSEQNYAGLNFDNRNWMWVDNNIAGIETYNKDTDTNYNWDFNANGELVLPEGGDIKDRDGNSVLVKTTTNGTFSTLPDFLDFLQNTRLKTGQNSEGVYFSGNAGNNVEAYPVRTNFDIGQNTKVTVTVDMVVNDECSDFGMCVFPSGGHPQWLWGSDESRIAVQYGCGQPSIYGLNDGVEGNADFSGPATRRVRFTYDPVNTPNVTLETLDTNDTVLDTITLNETLGETPQGAYRIGFASDQDNGTLRTYMKNLIIAIDGGATYTDTLIVSGGSTAELTGDGYVSGTGFKRTINVNYEGYQGGESTTVWISPSDAVGISNGDTITFRNGDVRTIDTVTDYEGYFQLQWTGSISTGDFEPAYPLTVTTANYEPEIKNTARIIPDASTQGSGQYMDVYVGGSQVLDNKHVHMAGHTTDTEVFLGTDNNFVSAKDKGGSPARVNLQSENDITVSNTNLRMNQGSSFASIYGDGENRSLHGYQEDITWNVVASDDQGNYYVGGEATGYSEAMISKYGPNGELVWKRLVNGDNTTAGKVDGAAYNPDTDEVAFAVGTNEGRSHAYHKIEVFDAQTGEHKSSTDVYDTDSWFKVHEMVYHPTLGYAIVGDTYGERLSTSVLTSTGATGLGIIELPIAGVAINSVYPKNSENWYITGTNLPYDVYLYSSIGIYQNLPVTTVTGSGSGATLTFRIDYNTMSYAFWSAGDQIGDGYNIGDDLKILGSLVGGADGVNDITFKANYSGGLYNIDNLGGTANPQYLRIDMGYSMGWASTDFSGGTFTLKFYENSLGFVWTNSWSKCYQPANFVSSSSNSFARAIAVDQYDNGLVVGGYDGNVNKGFVWKLDASGNTQWIRGVEQDGNTVSSIAVSKSNGAIYFATEWNSINKFTHGGTLIKRVQPDGMWGHSIPQVALQQELDGEEYLYVGGRFGSAWSNNSGFMLNKLDSNLVPIWSRNIWNDQQEINISYDIPHRDFALGRNNAVLVGYTYAMSYDYYNAVLLGISIDNEFDNVSSDGWNLQIAGRIVRYIDITNSVNDYDFLTTGGGTTASTSLQTQIDTDSLDWTQWSWKSVIVNLNSMNHGIVGVQGIQFADGGLLDHNPGDIPPSPTDFYQNGWNYTLQLRDRGRFIINQQRPNNTYAQNLYITVPKNTNVMFPVGSVITLINSSSAEANGYRIYVQPENYNNSDAPKIWATGFQNYSTWSFQGIQTATLMKINSNEWLLTANSVTNED